MLKIQCTGRMDFSRLARGALALAAMALLSHARVMLNLAPFALALFAAGLYAQISPAALLAGAVLGALRFPLAQSDLLLPSGCALILLGALLADRFPARAPLREGPLSALLAGLGTLLPGLAASGPEAYGALLALLAASAAVACAPAFSTLLAWRPGVRAGMDERACAALALYALLMGACALWPPGAYFLACLASLAAAHASVGAGAAMGALLMCALLSGGGEMVTAASVCLGATAAGALRPRGRLFAAPAFVLAAGLAGLYAPERYAGPVAPALAALCYVAVPEAWLREMCATLLCAAGRERAAREEASRALSALSAAFGELAAGVANLPEEGAVLSDMRRRLCAQCSLYERCWAGEDGRAVRAMCRSIADAAAQGETDEDETPPDLMRVCRRGIGCARWRGRRRSPWARAAARRRPARCSGRPSASSGTWRERACVRAIRRRAFALPGARARAPCAAASQAATRTCFAACPTAARWRWCATAWARARPRGRRASAPRGCCGNSFRRA